MTVNNLDTELDSHYVDVPEDSACVASSEDTLGLERIDETDVEDIYDNQRRPSLKFIDNDSTSMESSGHSVLGIQFAPINIPLERRLQTLSVLLWFSFLLIIGWVSALILAYIAAYTNYWWFPLAYFTWYIGDRSICNKGGRRFSWFRELKLWKCYADFYPIKLIKTADLRPQKNYIMCYHPHGVLAGGVIASFATEGTGFSKTFPNITPYVLTLPLNFHFPFSRELLMASGMVSCSKESMDYLLGQAPGSGHALVLVPGGAKESLDAKPGEAKLYLKNRMGFIKMALRHGASLVPMYSFGENEIYDQVNNPEGSMVRRFQNKMQQLISFSPVLFKGRGIFQYSFGLLPFRRPMYTVVGSPIDVAKVTEPSSEQIINLHSKYTEAVIELYNKYRPKYSLIPNVDLKII